MESEKSYTVQFTELMEHFANLPVGSDYNKADIPNDITNKSLIACVCSFFSNLNRVEKAFCHILLEAPDGGTATVVGQKLATFLNEVAKNVPRIGSMVEASAERNGLKSIASTIGETLDNLRKI